MAVAWLLFCLLSVAEIIRFGATGLDPRCQFKKWNSWREGEKEREEKKKINNNDNNSREKSGSFARYSLLSLAPKPENVEEKVYKVKEQRKQTTCFLLDNSRARIIQTTSKQRLCNYSDTSSIIFPLHQVSKGPLYCEENENKTSQPGSDLTQYPIC